MDETRRDGAARGDRLRARFRTVFNALARECDLPPFPKVAARAVAMARDPTVRVDDVARVVSGDAALAAGVLRTAQSLTYLRRTPPRTLSETIATIGFDRLRSLLVAASARAVYRTGVGPTEELWAHALATALAADALAPDAPRGGPAFIAGLLHDVGRLVFVLTDATRYATLGAPDDVAERAAFGAPHALAGALLADLWGLDVEICNAILEHHAPNADGLSGRLAVADWIAYRIGRGARAGECPVPPWVTDPGAYDALAERVANAFDAEQRYFA